MPKETSDPCRADTDMDMRPSEYSAICNAAL